MNLHEYQAKRLFHDYAIPCPEGVLVSSSADIPVAVRQFSNDGCMIKAQVHAGGRGKAGGVIKAGNATEMEDAIAKLLGQRLVTPQTDALGLPISSVYIEPLTVINSEYYVGMLVDREHKRIAVIASDAGGMSIEEVAVQTPEKLYTEYVSPAVGLQAYQARNLGFKMGFDSKQVRQFSTILMQLYRLFIEKDASLLEINPLVTSEAGDLLALDAKLNIDDNALYRQKAIVALRDGSQEDAREMQAAEHGLNFIPLEGDIGCMVNGAGLAMATMDLIKLEGGEPANFLDVGGGATAERVAIAFKLILSDDNVRAVLVNIFGGIVRCDLIAEGIIQAVAEVGVNVPVVVRLEGTQAAQGRSLLADSNLAIIPAEDLAEAAKQVVAVAHEGGA
jgi:succinyl-CoA synthetase beta subunit